MCVEDGWWDATDAEPDQAEQAGCWRHTVIPIKRGGWLWQLTLCRILPQQNGCCSMSGEEECPDLAQCHLAVAEGWQQPQLTVFYQHPKNNFDQFASLKGNCYYCYWPLTGNYTKNSISIISAFSSFLCHLQDWKHCSVWGLRQKTPRGGLTPTRWSDILLVGCFSPWCLKPQNPQRVLSAHR